MQSPAQPTAIITIALQQFRALGGIFPITASFSLDPSSAPLFSLNGKSIVVHTFGPTALTFQLPDPGYVLLGVAFEADGTSRPSSGRTQFPLVKIQRSVAGSSLTVEDEGGTAAPFSYLLLVQATATGEIGVIDPSIENEPQ
jgi:hypothetical protein